MPETLKMSEKPRKSHFLAQPVDIYATKEFHEFRPALLVMGLAYRGDPGLRPKRF